MHAAQLFKRLEKCTFVEFIVIIGKLVCEVLPLFSYWLPAFARYARPFLRQRTLTSALSSIRPAKARRRLSLKQAEKGFSILFPALTGGRTRPHSLASAVADCRSIFGFYSVSSRTTAVTICALI